MLPGTNITKEKMFFVHRELLNAFGAIGENMWSEQVLLNSSKNSIC